MGHEARGARGGAWGGEARLILVACSRRLAVAETCARAAERSTRAAPGSGQASGQGSGQASGQASGSGQGSGSGLGLGLGSGLVELEPEGGTAEAEAGRDQAERREDVHGGQPMESTGTYRKSKTSFTLARSTGVALSYDVQGYGGRHAYQW